MPMQEKIFDLPDPVKLLQQLIRFNTTNPPGNEAECICYINNLLTAAGFEPCILEKKEGRPNLIARWRGTGAAPPFLMYGHADVVTVEHQEWTYPPFEGAIADGCVWGRGTLDMKGALAMMIMAMMRAKASQKQFPGDIILAVVSDEEDEGEFGARFLVEEHREIFKNISYAIGEFGAFSMPMGRKTFYPIMVAEKQKCSLRTSIKGPGGHGSMPMRNGAMAGLARLLDKLNRGRLPVHITPPSRMMLESMAAHMPLSQQPVVKGLLNPFWTDRIIGLLGAKGRFFDPLLHNTVNATIVRGGDKINVIPSEITVDLDGRLLSGFTPEEMLRELNALVGLEYQFQVTSFIPGPVAVNMGLFDTLAKILREADPAAIPIPFVIGAVTDARYFARLGIQTYGFTPMILPPDIDFSRLIHSADERIPIAALEFGARAMEKLLGSLK